MSSMSKTVSMSSIPSNPKMSHEMDLSGQGFDHFSDEEIYNEKERELNILYIPMKLKFLLLMNY